MDTCRSCGQILRLRNHYREEAERLERLKQEKKRGGEGVAEPGRPREVVKPDAFDLRVALGWFGSHRHLPPEEWNGGHPAMELVEGVPRRLLAEARWCTDSRFQQRARRFSVRLLAALAGCSERTARASVKEGRDKLGEPDLEWAEEDEWFVGNPTRKEKEAAKKAAQRDRLDPGNQTECEWTELPEPLPSKPELGPEAIKQALRQLFPED